MTTDNKNIYAKLFEAKKEIGTISKDSTNPFFNSKYFDINALIEHVEPILRTHGLLVLQPIIDNQVCTQIIDFESGELITSSVKLNSIDPQKVGSEITYFRRYTLQSLLSLQAEDDDANKASGHTSTEKQDERPWLNENTENFIEAMKYVAGKGDKAIKDIEKKYRLSKTMKDKLTVASK